MVWVRDRISGTFIDEFETKQEARDVIREYEKEDKENEVFEEDFYEIYDPENNEIIALNEKVTARTY